MPKHRRHPRFSFSEMTHLLVSGNSEDTLVQAYPFSAGFGGLGVYTMRPIPVGHELTTRLLISQKTGDCAIETMDCTVRWCNTLGSMYRIGIEFKGINLRDHTSFLGHLKAIQRWQ